MIVFFFIIPVCTLLLDLVFHLIILVLSFWRKDILEILKCIFYIITMIDHLGCGILQKLKQIISLYFGFHHYVESCCQQHCNSIIWSLSSLFSDFQHFFIDPCVKRNVIIQYKRKYYHKKTVVECKKQCWEIHGRCQ